MERCLVPALWITAVSRLADRLSGKYPNTGRGGFGAGDRGGKGVREVPWLGYRGYRGRVTLAATGHAVSRGRRGRAIGLRGSAAGGFFVGHLDARGVLKLRLEQSFRTDVV